MFPFAVETEQGQQDGWGFGSVSGGSMFGSGSAGWGSSGSSSEYYGGANLSWNNVAFCDLKSGTSRLLLDGPALITEFHALGEKDGPVTGDYMLFAIATEDSNHDGVISAADAVGLYRTTASGTALTPITPPDTQLLDVHNFGESLVIRVVQDANHDGKFTSKDPVQVLRVNWQTWEPAVVLIADDLRQRAFDAATRGPAPAHAPAATAPSR